jgi:hypothetical protein
MSTDRKKHRLELWAQRQVDTRGAHRCLHRGETGGLGVAGVLQRHRAEVGVLDDELAARCQRHHEPAASPDRVGKVQQQHSRQDQVEAGRRERGGCDVRPPHFDDLAVERLQPLCLDVDREHVAGGCDPFREPPGHRPAAASGLQTVPTRLHARGLELAERHRPVKRIEQRQPSSPSIIATMRQHVTTHREPRPETTQLAHHAGVAFASGSASDVTIASATYQSSPCGCCGVPEYGFLSRHRAPRDAPYEAASFCAKEPADSTSVSAAERWGSRCRTADGIVRRRQRVAASGTPREAAMWVSVRRARRR